MALRMDESIQDKMMIFGPGFFARQQSASSGAIMDEKRPMVLYPFMLLNEKRVLTEEHGARQHRVLNGWNDFRVILLMFENPVY
jgi:hypothetical protein